MSIIRDFIEYYRLPAEIKVNLLDFEIKHTLLNGHEERYYYSLDGSNHYTMIVDMFTHDNVRYRRTYMTYNTNFGILYMTNEYEYGKKSRTDTFVYGTGVTEGAIVQVDTVETDTNIIWSNAPPSTGWPYYDFGGRIMSIVAGDDIGVDNTDQRNPIVSVTGDFVTRDQLYTILGDYTQAKFDWFTWVDGTYGSRTSIPTNGSVQHWTVPNAEENSIIKVHLWGASGGGYTYGELVVKSPENFVESNPSHVMVGQVLCVHVGPAKTTNYLDLQVGRAAIWRNDTANFNSYLDELLVAGGGGGGGLIGATGGTSAWPGVPGGTGGTQSAPGTDPGNAAGNGYRLWGGYLSWATCDGLKASVAGDGYYGGGAGYGGDYQDNGCRHYASGGGGGSSIIGPPAIGSLQNARTDSFVGPVYPPNASSPAWGMSAGQPGFPGRVVFETTTVITTGDEEKSVYNDSSISGGDITKSGANQLTISPIACIDSTKEVELITTVNKTLSIPSGLLNQIYHIFAVRFKVDGSTGFKAYTTEVEAGSDTSINAYRWICFWRTTSTGSLVEAIMVAGLMQFGRASQNIMATGLTTIFSTKDHSILLPVNKISSIRYGTNGTGDPSTGKAYLYTSLDGINSEEFIGYNYSPELDDDHSAWYNTNYGEGSELPFTTSRMFRTVGSMPGQNILVHSVRLRRGGEGGGLSIPSAAVPTSQDISGGDITKTGDNQITITPIVCLDTTGTVALSTIANTNLVIPSTVADQLYHIFAVRLVSDGSTTFKAYTTEAGAASDNLINAYRWIDFWRTNSTNGCCDGFSKNGVHWNYRYDENVIMPLTTVPQNGGISIPVNFPSFAPTGRFTDILFGSHSTCNGPISMSGVPGSSQALSVGSGGANGDGNINEWGSDSAFIPMTEPTLYWGGGSLTTWEGGVGFAVHAVKLKRTTGSGAGVRPVISSVTPITGGIYGGDIERVGINQLMIDPISCLDSTGSVSLHTGTVIYLNIPSAPVNQLYHIFAVRLASDGSTTFKAYTTEAGAASDNFINAYRWICFWRTNPSGYCYPGILRNGLLAFGGPPVYNSAHNYYYNEPEFFPNVDGYTPPPADTSNAGIQVGTFTLTGVGETGATAHNFININSVVPISRIRKLYPYVYSWRSAGVNAYVSIGIKECIAPGMYGSFMQGTELVLSMSAHFSTTINAAAFIKSVEIIN